MPTAITWTDETWNPVTGCSHVSPGCEFCYAEKLTLRFHPDSKPWGAQYAAENVILHPERLRVPLTWKRPRRVFVNSMSDLFHELVPFEFIARVWDVMFEADRHTFQILTKRPERMREFAIWMNDTQFRRIDYENVWLGTSAENQACADLRIPILLSVPAALHFVSVEPLLGPVTLERWIGSAPLISWCIVGGESGGPAARRLVQPDGHGAWRATGEAESWVRAIRDQCLSADVAFHFKQFGGSTHASGGRILDGRTWDDIPRRPPAEPTAHAIK